MNLSPATTIPAREGRATTTKETFSRETTVSIDIQADPGIVWGLLTNASDFARWNSTVVSLEGEIRAGETIEIRSTLDESRTFKMKVKELEPERRLVWGDNKGNRIYTLNETEGDAVTFTMTEKIGGILFPLYGRMIPSFDESFEQFAADLKTQAETIQNS